MTEEAAIDGEKKHNLFMSAENVQGSLLEEYIALKTRPYGLLWAAGNVLRAVDFCDVSGCFLLQVKNKYNTENSSSAAIRKGTAVQKWFRLGEKRVNGIIMPQFQWEKLNAALNESLSPSAIRAPLTLSEDDYRQFLARVAKENPNLVTDL